MRDDVQYFIISCAHGQAMAVAVANRYTLCVLVDHCSRSWTPCV